MREKQSLTAELTATLAQQSQELREAKKVLDDQAPLGWNELKWSEMKWKKKEICFQKLKVA